MSVVPIGSVVAYAPYAEATLPTSQPDHPGQESEPDYALAVRQQPEHARVAIGKEKDRKPVDPPPILQLKVSQKKDPLQNFLQSPYFFMTSTLIKSEGGQDDPPPNGLVGTLVSSLHRLKDTDNQDGGFFVFGDLSVKQEGRYKLRFTLYTMKGNECVQLASATSDNFEVFAAKTFPGLAESTFLTRSFSDQGVRLRLRKDSRTMSTRKRNATAAEFARKHSGHERDSQRRLQQGRSNSGEEGLPYGSQGSIYDSPSGYPYEVDPMAHPNKRQRMDSSQAYAQDMQYPQTRYPAHMQIPATSAPYSMQTQSPAPLHYGPHHLGRIDTQHLGSIAPSANSAGAAYQSPSTRHSPHAFAYGGLQGSPSSTLPYQPASATVTSAHTLTGSPHGDYRPHPGPMYPTGTSADASPRAHPTPNSSTSPPDANYTPSAPIGHYPQAYSYASQPLADHQSQLPLPNVAGRPNGHGPMDMHLSAGMPMAIPYGDSEGQNTGPSS